MPNSLNAELVGLTTRVAQECRSLWSHLGDITTLKTQDKSTLVAAVNELHDQPYPTEVDDAVTSGEKTWSSVKISDLLSQKTDVKISDLTPSSTTVYSSTKTQQLVDQVGDWLIEDTGSSVSRTYSSEKILSVITTKIEQSVGAAPELLDTISELSDAIANDPNFAVSIQNQLAKRVRVDGPSVFTDEEKQIARSNIGAASMTDVMGISLDLDGSVRGLIVGAATQTRAALNSLFVTKAEAVSNAASSSVMRRDASGRAQVADPSSTLDIVNFQWAESRYARANHEHSEITSAATTPTPNALAKYSSSSRLTTADPSNNTEAVNLQTLNTRMGGKVFWFGTENEYNAIPTKNVNTVYFLIS